MQIPWRAVEAMHWQLGETDMAVRAGVVPFSLTSVNAQQDNNRTSPSRGHVHSQSQGSVPRSDLHILGRYAPPRGTAPSLPPSHLAHHHQHPPPPSHPLTIPPPIPSMSSGPGRGTLPRRESMPPRPTPADFMYDHHTPPAPGPGLPPIQPPGGRERGGVGGVGGGMQLPSVAELTTGVSPYSTPAYSLGGMSASPSATASPRTSVLQGPPLTYSPGDSASKRGRSTPDSGREATRRRH